MHAAVTPSLECLVYPLCFSRKAFYLSLAPKECSPPASVRQSKDAWQAAWTMSLPWPCMFRCFSVAKRRRGIALVNRIAQKYGLRLILLPANPHNGTQLCLVSIEHSPPPSTLASLLLPLLVSLSITSADPSDRRAEHHVTSCSSCGSEVRVSTQVARGLGQPSGVGSASDDAHMPTRVKGTGPLPLQVDCQIKGSGKQEGQAGTEAKQKAKEEDGGEGGETNQSQRWKVKENGASSGAWATSTTASHTPAPGDLLPPPPTPPPLSALMSGILLLPSNQVASLSSSEILPSPVKRRSAAPAAVSNVGSTEEEGLQREAICGGYRSRREIRLLAGLLQC